MSGSPGPKSYASYLHEILRNSMIKFLSSHQIRPAQVAKDLKISRASVNNWLYGKNYPSLELFYLFCKQYEADPATLLGLNEKKEEH